MSGKQHLEPPELFPSRAHGFSQVVTAPPGRLVFVSGQVACDREMNPVGGRDLAAQAEQALANLRSALRAAGAAPADVTMLRVYLVDPTPEETGALSPLLAGFFAGGPPPASTWVAVAALAAPGFRIEIEAIAVVGP